MLRLSVQYHLSVYRTAETLFSFSFFKEKKKKQFFLYWQRLESREEGRHDGPLAVSISFRKPQVFVTLADIDLPLRPRPPNKLIIGCKLNSQMWSAERSLDVYVHKAVERSSQLGQSAKVRLFVSAECTRRGESQISDRQHVLVFNVAPVQRTKTGGSRGGCRVLVCRDLRLVFLPQHGVCLPGANTCTPTATALSAR